MVALYYTALTATLLTPQAFAQVQEKVQLNVFTEWM